MGSKSKQYSRGVLIDMCGGSEEAIQEMFPNIVLKHDGLWMNWNAGERLATEIDQRHWRSRPSDMSDAEYTSLAATMAQHRRTAEAIGWIWQPVASREVAALPIPFTSFQLAAFMYAGDGRHLYDRFDFGAVISKDDLEILRPTNSQRSAMNERYLEGAREVDRDAPRKFEDALKDLGYNADEAREALSEAIRLVRQAEAKFPRTDDGDRHATNWLLNDAPNELAQDTTAVTETRTAAKATRMPEPVLSHDETPATSVESTPVLNRMKNRSNLLGAVIDQARSQALDGDDWMSVWAALVVIAMSVDRPAPLLGYTEGEGVKYQTDKEEMPVGFLTREALRKRLTRSA